MVNQESGSESQTSSIAVPTSFEDLAAYRRQWIDSVLHPWCRQAPLKQLRQAEIEWLDIAGRVDIDATLWTWAWERFPVLTHPEMSGVNETHAVRVTLKDGTVIDGFPDSRESRRGTLVLARLSVDTTDATGTGPVSIDDIESVEALP